MCNRGVLLSYCCKNVRVLSSLVLASQQHVQLLAGSLYVPLSTASVATLNIMQAGGAPDGSQDQIVGSLSSQSSASASTLLLTAADSTGSTSGGLRVMCLLWLSAAFTTSVCICYEDMSAFLLQSGQCYSFLSIRHVCQQ